MKSLDTIRWRIILGMSGLLAGLVIAANKRHAVGVPRRRMLVSRGCESQIKCYVLRF